MTLPILSCDGCGGCCMEMRSPPFLRDETDARWKALSPAMQAEIQRRAMDGRDEYVPCWWLDIATRRCLHYDLRPDVCRDYQAGTDSCLGFRETFLPVEVPAC